MAAHHSYKNPPVFREDMSYESWKNEVEMWQFVTDLDPKKQAFAIALSLTGQAKEAALQFKASDLNSVDGLKKLLESLDLVFKKDVVDSQYECYKNFENFRQSDEMKMTDYITDFEQRYNKLKNKHAMEYPDPVLAFKLLDNTKLSTKDRQLALTACADIKFASMKCALRRIFSEEHSSHSVGSLDLGVKLKQEAADVFVADSWKFRPNSKWKDARDASLRPKDRQKGTNPFDRFGKRSKCAVCDSVFHWARECPNNERKGESKSEQVNITLFTEQCDMNQVFMTESFGAAVIDTACTRTVCGSKWLENYRDGLSESEKEQVVECESSQEFRFGDGVSVKSFENVIFPAMIGETKCKISTEVVNCDIPLLLSKDSLKKASTVLDLCNDTATMFGNPVDLEFTSSGHYCVNLKGKNEDVNMMNEVMALNVETVCDKRMLVKLHRQFGHASAEKLESLFKNAGLIDKEVCVLLRKIVEDCDICVRYKRTPPKPAVGLPLATEFNQVVGVDLHTIKPGLYYMHMIDLFTRYSAACVIHNKLPSTIVNKFIQTWISVHGAPKSIISDNGGEFNNPDFRDMAENFNIGIKTTPAESPWSNGLPERHNRSLTEVAIKVKEDTSCDWDTTISWAVSAKNSLSNVHGYSAHQLVYGANPNLPSVLIDSLPALEGSTVSRDVADHLIAMRSARKAFIESESSERIRRALRKQTRTYNDINYVTGDRVYYKRLGSDEWRGPGIVIGQDGVVVFVRHGGTYVRVHKCRLSLKNLDQCQVSVQNMQSSISQDSLVNPLESVQSDQVNDSAVVDCDSEDEAESSRNMNDRSESNDRVIDVVELDVDVEQPEVLRQIRPRVGDCVKFAGEDGQVSMVKVISRAGKASGKLCHWWNVEYLCPDSMIGEKKSIDFETLKDLDKVAEDEVVNGVDSSETVYVVENKSFDNAKAEELAKWVEFAVYEQVPNVGQKCVSTRWICTMKETTNGTIPKARLVARGFEDSERDEISKDSPTCSKEALRLILAIIAQKRWKPRSMDIKTAFLQGLPMTRDIYLKPPREADVEKGMIWHLKKCVYGLADASLCWYKKVKEVMIACGAKMSLIDPAVFYWLDDDENLVGVLASHVDDFIWAGNKVFEDSVIERVRSLLDVGREESDVFKYVGLNLVSHDDNISIDQTSYLSCLHPVSLDKCRLRNKDSVLNENELEALRTKVGQIMWVATQTRPDVMFEACSLTSSWKNARVSDVIELNKVIRKIKSEIVKLNFQYLGDDESLKLVVYSDASLGNMSDGGSQGGYVVMLVGDNRRFSPIAWQSKKIRRVVRSTIAAETLALADAVDSAVYIAQLYAEITSGQLKSGLLPIECITDNHSLYDTLHSTNHVGEKRLRIEISGIKELIQSGQVSKVKWNSAKTQLADCLTKRGASSLALLGALEEGVWDF